MFVQEKEHALILIAANALQAIMDLNVSPTIAMELFTASKEFVQGQVFVPIPIIVHAIVDSEEVGVNFLIATPHFSTVPMCVLEMVSVSHQTNATVQMDIMEQFVTFTIAVVSFSMTPLYVQSMVNVISLICVNVRMATTDKIVRNTRALVQFNITQAYVLEMVHVLQLTHVLASPVTLVLNVIHLIVMVRIPATVVCARGMVVVCLPTTVCVYLVTMEILVTCLNALTEPIQTTPLAVERGLVWPQIIVPA